MTNELATQDANELAIDTGQTYFNDSQLAVLRQIGVEDATPADLQVFFHHCKRTGLDPFARQIYMIGRSTEVDVRVELDNGNSRVEKRRVMKYTIQTGIDGYRLIGKRAAQRENALVSHDDPQWVDKDGVWRDHWPKTLGTPVAAKYTIRVNGAPYTATCMFDEFAQYSGRGELTSMWKKMPANQLAVRAEAAAWRKAFPADFSDIHEAGSVQVIDQDGALAPPQRSRSAPITEAEIIGQPIPARQQAVADAQAQIDADAAPEQTMAESPDDPADAAQNRQMHALFRDLNIKDRGDRLAVTGAILGFKLDSSSGLTSTEADSIISTLKLWKSGRDEDGNEIDAQDVIREILNRASLAESESSSPETEQEGN